MLSDYYDLPVNERWVYVILIGLVIGLVLGIFLRRESIKRKPVYGGMSAQLFHYLACSTMAGLIPVIFIALFSKLHILRVIATGASFSLSTLLLLLVFAVFESQAKPVEVKPVRELD
jgi:hypothetical protein